MNPKCKCGHDKRGHFMQQGLCVDDLCSCLKFEEAVPAALVQVFCTGCYMECDAPAYRGMVPYCRLCVELLQPVAAGEGCQGEPYWQLMEKIERQQRVQKKIWEF